MINFENSDISNIVIHHVGNKFEGGGLTLSDGCFLPEDPDVVNLLKSYFLSAICPNSRTSVRTIQQPEYQTRRIVYRSFSKL